LRKALEISLILNNEFEIARINYRIADLEFSTGSWDMALQRHKEALKNAEENKQYLMMASIYNHLSWLNSLLGLYSTANDYINKADQKMKELNDDERLYELDKCDILGEPDEDAVKTNVTLRRKEEIAPQLEQMIGITKVRTSFLLGNTGSQIATDLQKHVSATDLSIQTIALIYLGAVDGINGDINSARKSFRKAEDTINHINTTANQKWTTRMVVCMVELHYFEAFINFIDGSTENAIKIIQKGLTDLMSKEKGLLSNSQMTEVQVNQPLITRYLGRLRFVYALILTEQREFQDADKLFNTLDNSDAYIVMAKRWLLGNRYYYSGDYDQACNWFKETDKQQQEMGYTVDHYEGIIVRLMIRACYSKLIGGKKNEAITANENSYIYKAYSKKLSL
jgi:tetratricopeptide (TPR) repeat protein